KSILKTYFRPEFLNRIDEILVFEPLSKEDIKRIVEIQLAKVAERLAARKITLEITDAAKEKIAEAGYDPDFGARPLKRTIQREVLDKLSTELLAGKFAEGDKIKVDADKKGIKFKK
ncbi:MAG: type VI secretion system ATPase TssH, partial [Abditibacteriota bacterium]|nr:type VI secretion system ATPase TssH [Abditibacteriota bacterium]